MGDGPIPYEAAHANSMGTLQPMLVSRYGNCTDCSVSRLGQTKCHDQLVCTDIVGGTIMRYCRCSLVSQLNPG